MQSTDQPISKGWSALRHSCAVSSKIDLPI